MEQFELIIAYIMTAVVGLCVGSFLNVVIYRLPRNMSLATPSSHCTTCDYKLRWYDNIPVLSYLMLGGKCRKCKQHISFRYTAVELLNTALWVLCVPLFYRESYFYFGASLIVCSVCICVFFIDLEHMIIPDRFQLILLAMGVVMTVFDKNFDWISHVIGGVAAFALFFGVSWLFGKLLKREALGGGDVKFAGVAGLILGWQKLLLMMLIASIGGSIFMLAKRAKDGESKEIPFGPFLTAGLIIAMFAGTFIVRWYMGLLGF